MQSFYLDLQLLDAFYPGHKYHHTASATMFYALREGLAMVAEEGLHARWERHRTNHEAFVAGIEAMGLSWQEVEPHRAKALALRLAHVGVSRAKDLVHARKGRRAVGHGPDGLDPADAVPLPDSGDMEGRQQLGRDAAVSARRGAYGDPRASGDLREGRRHERARDERNLAPGHVDPDPADGVELLAHLGPVPVPRGPVRGQGLPAKVLDGGACRH